MSTAQKTDKNPPTPGQLLARWRADRGRSLAQVAALLTAAGCEKTRAAVHHYERGGGMRREVADAVVEAFQLDEEQARSLYEAAGFLVHLAPPAAP